MVNKIPISVSTILEARKEVAWEFTKETVFS